MQFDIAIAITNVTGQLLGILGAAFFHSSKLFRTQKIAHYVHCQKYLSEDILYP